MKRPLKEVAREIAEWVAGDIIVEDRLQLIRELREALAEQEKVTVRSLGVRKIRFIYDDIEYEWTGGFGEVFSSRERVKVGTVRVIGTILFHAWLVETFLFRKPKVSWSIINPDAETIQAIKRAIFD